MICRIYRCRPEGSNFLISLDRGYIRFRFKICKHIDNLEALNMIKSKLNVGNVTIEKSKKADVLLLYKIFFLLRNKRCDIEYLSI